MRLTGDGRAWAMSLADQPAYRRKAGANEPNTSFSRAVYFIRVAQKELFGDKY